MKRFSIVLSAAFAFAALVSCNKEIDTPSENIPAPGEVPFALNAEVPQTKVAFGNDWSLAWENGDVIYAVTEDQEWGVPYKTDNSTESIAEFEYDGSIFSTQKTISGGEHTFNFIYAPANQKTYHRGDQTTFKISETQNLNCSEPTANLKSYYPLAGQVTVTTPVASINATMSHLATIVKVTLKNKTKDAININSFKIDMPSAEIAGTYTVIFGENPTLSTEGIKSPKTSVTVNLENGAIAAGAEMPVYVVMAPVANYTGDITFTATDSEGNDYTKTNSVTGVNFAAGTYNSASFSLNTIEKPAYTLNFIKDPASSTYTSAHTTTSNGVEWSVFGNQSLGDYLRIGGKNTTATNRTIASTTPMPAIVDKVVIKHSGTGNGKESQITVNYISLEVSSTSSFTSPIQTIKIDNPSVSSSGSLEFLPSTSWAAGSFYRILVNYQITGTNNCYLTINSVQFFGETADVKVPENLEMSEITLANHTQNSLTFSWNAVANASGYQVFFDNVDKGTITETSYTIEGLSAGTEHTIAVKAVGDGTNYKTSSAKSLKASTDPDETAETIKMTFNENDGWTISAEAKASYWVINDGSFIETPSIEFSSIKSITLNMRTYGGAQFKTVDVSFGDTKIASIDATSNSLTNITTDSITSVSGKGALRFTSPTTSAANGPGIANITVVYKK